MCHVNVKDGSEVMIELCKEIPATTEQNYGEGRLKDGYVLPLINFGVSTV